MSQTELKRTSNQMQKGFSRYEENLSDKSYLSLANCAPCMRLGFRALPMIDTRLTWLHAYQPYPSLICALAPRRFYPHQYAPYVPLSCFVLCCYN